jgi:hypothetical protein
MRSIAGVCPRTKRMKQIVPVILAVTAILTGLTIAIINQGNYLKGYGWAIPYLFALIVVLLVLATVIAVINSKREKKNDPPPAPPPVEVRQETKQIVNQHFHLGAHDDASVTAKLEKARHERVILDFLKRSEHRFYEIPELANATGISKPNTRAALERLETQKSVWKVGHLDIIEGGYAWKLDDLELDDKC